MPVIVFPFAPVAWQRVKRSRNGAAYVPTKTRRYKADIALWAAKYFSAPLDGPISISVQFCVKKPNRPKHPKFPITRPDADNFLKGILDGCNGIVWKDDSQVVEIRASKVYADPEIGPMITLFVRPM